MRKYDLISALSAETSREVARNEESWKKYLNTASRLYKYPFKDQLLIYAQRPDATACASIEIWNEKMHCWVNKGAKGIALIDEEGNTHSGLRYVFDISDVHKARRIGRFPQLWEMREEHQEAVLDRLEGIYGETNRQAGFTDRIREIAARIALDCYEELALDMEYLKEGSFLEELDGLNIAVRVRETLADSIAYTVLKRCGMEDVELAEEIQFPYIHEFNTVETLSHIGDSISDLSKPVLMEIGKAIGAYDREHARNEASKNFVEKGLANTSGTRYNALKRESKTEDVQSTTQTGNAGERGKYDETELREERGLHDTDAADGRTAGGDTDEVRTDEEELLTGTQEGNLHRASAEREIERASSDHSGTGRAEDGISDSADGGSGGRDGGTESSRSDEMGGDDEQYQALGGGDRAEGAGIQPVKEEKIENKELAEPDNGESALSGFSLSGEEIINRHWAEIEKGILQFDEFMVHKCPDIAGVMLFEPDKDKQTEYIKNSYRHGEDTEFNIGEKIAGYRADESGMTLWSGTHMNRKAEAVVSWETVRDSIAFYMEKGEYLKEGQIPQWEEPKETEVYQQLSLFPTIEEQIGTIEAAQAGEKYTMPAAFSLPQEQLEAILRTGGGRNNSRSRIYAKYQQGKTPGEMAEFLKNEYKTTGKGFDFGNNPISVWFNESGMSIGYGMSAKENPVAVMGWTEIEGIVRSMVEQGSYMGVNEVFLVDAIERQRVSNDLFHFFRDGIGEVPEDIPIKSYNYPESITKLCELLSTQEGRDIVAGELSKVKEQLDTGEKKVRWRYVKKPEHLLSEIADLSTEKKEYPVQDSVEVLQEDFITQDEIDTRLTGGSNFHNGHFRIYEYFMEGHDKKDCIAFLKNEYGTGGSSHALIGSDTGHEDHDAKGIRLEKGSYGDPYAKVLLKWNVVEKRIRELVKADKYLTSEGKEAYAQYKKEQAEEAMRREQEKLEHGIRIECKDAIEKAVAENFDGYTLTGDAAEGVIRQYGKERVEIVLANTITQLSHDGRFSPDNKEWAKSLVPSADWQTRDYIVTSHPAVLDGFTNQAREYIERDRELDRAGIPEPEKETSGQNANHSENQNGLKSGDDFADVDTAEVRRKLESGEAAKDVDELSDFAEKAVEESGGEEYKRFSVTETSDAYPPGEDFAIWDDTLDDYHFDSDGRIHTFGTQEEAEEYLEKVEKETAPPEQGALVSEKLTDLEKKAVEIAKGYESLPLMEKIGVIAQTFGCTSGEIETSPCTGKWRGTSDISIRFDNGASLFVGNYRTPQAKNAKVQNECVNAALVRFNPEIVAATKEAAIEPLREREAKDNGIAVQKGLKPYTLLNVEISDGTDNKGGYLGWYYVTLAIDGKIHAHLETGLNHDISDGKVSKEPTRENYFAAGALKETDVDYVFNNVGFSSTSGLYSLPIGKDVLERAKKMLAERREAAELAEMSAVVKICGALSMKDVVGWNKDTGAVAIEDADRRLEGKAVYDALFLEAADYVLMQSLSGNAEKAVEMDALLKEAQKYAARYGNEPEQQKEEHAAEVPEAELERETAETIAAEPEVNTEKPETVTEPEKSSGKVSEKEPEVDKSGASNYHISFNEAENTGKGFAPKEKFRQNVEAIRTLERIEGERRTATPEEQEILAKYVGWGGLADAFDSSKANWANEYQELKNLLSPEEYASARESTLNAHYTSPVIIQAIYDAVGKMGFTRGNVLDMAVA